MFADPRVETVYQRYEARAAADRARMAELGPAGFAIRDEFLLPVGAEVGRLLHALVLARKPARILELGTSYGYSTLFLAEAARSVGANLVTIEIAGYKQAHARAELAAAGLDAHVDFRCGDALALLAADEGPWDFVLLDIWKELYLPCFEAFYPKLSEEAVIASDNMIEPAMARDDVRRYRQAVRARPDLQTALLPVGSGVELTVRWSADNAKL
ncbi:MAG: class I SAM-dependent methyltransferase [Sphingomonadales bacterium]|nr:class I SAM-dependent methyltransferase [Sphingomonadales bacterium]